jgi:hypothetical protein
MSRDQQVLELRKMVSRRVADWIFWIGLGVVVICVVLGLSGNGHGWTMGAFFLTVILVALRRVSVHQRNAVAALELKREAPATVAIEIEETSESTRYYAQVRVSTGEAWRMEFVPLYWKPQSGSFPAQACYASAVEWPALLILAEGIFYPTYEPKRLAS